MNLTPKQHDIVKKMRDGWELRSSITFEGGSWLRKGDKMHYINGNTFNSLVTKKVIYQSERRFPTATYALTEDWA